MCGNLGPLRASGARTRCSRVLGTYLPTIPDMHLVELCWRRYWYAPYRSIWGMGPHMRGRLPVHRPKRSGSAREATRLDDPAVDVYISLPPLEYSLEANPDTFFYIESGGVLGGYIHGE